MFKDFPLNFDVTTWRLSQWISTIAFLLVIAVSLHQNFGYLGEYAINFVTPIGFISFIALIVQQCYTYGGYISNTLKDIIVPMCIITGCFVIELCFSYLLSNMGYTPTWSTYFVRYGLFLSQSLVMLWVYHDVQFLEIPKEELDKGINIDYNHKKIVVNNSKYTRNRNVK